MTMRRDTPFVPLGRCRPQRQRASERRLRHRRNGPRTAGPVTRRWWQRPRLLFAVPTRRTIGLRVYACAALGFAVADSLARTLIRDRGMDMTFILALTALVCAHVVDQQIQRRTLRRYSHAWYCRTFAAHVRRDGRVGCRHCGDRRIRSDVLSHHHDYRAHVCTACDATLFYRHQ